MWLDLNKDGETTTEEFNACINAKDSKTGQDAFTAEEKIAAQKTFKEADTNNDGKVDTTEAIKYSFQNGRESISQDDLTKAYGEEKTKEMMKYDKDGNGKLDKKEFDEATKEKDGINFKDPKVILAIIGVAITVIGVIAALCVWLSRRSKKKKAEQAARTNHQPQSESDNTSVSTGNSAGQVHTPISTDMQQQSNDAFNQYSQSDINNTQQPLNLNDSRNKSMDMGR